MKFYSSCSNVKPLETEENHGTYYVREDIVYNEEKKIYEYQEAVCTENEYRIHNLERQSIEALEAIAELYEVMEV